MQGGHPIDVALVVVGAGKPHEWSRVSHELSVVSPDEGGRESGRIDPCRTANIGEPAESRIRAEEGRYT